MVSGPNGNANPEVSPAGPASMNEVFPLEKAAEAYQHMISGKARFRVLVTTGN
jgi:D-arabinose 1-dehydrogenase-like Zn-dependent alcohol dehydrogenase